VLTTNNDELKLDDNPSLIYKNYN